MSQNKNEVIPGIDKEIEVLEKKLNAKKEAIIKKEKVITKKDITSDLQGKIGKLVNTLNESDLYTVTQFINDLDAGKSISEAPKLKDKIKEV